MRKILFIRYILLSILLLFSFLNQSYAYKLFGFKWASGSYNYYINPIGIDNSTNYSSHSSAVISAASQWTSVGTTNVSINYLGTTTNTGWGINDGVNVITWKTNGWSGSVIGLSTYWYSGGNIIDSDIKLNTAFANDSRLPLLVTHEVGHSLGIGHTRESGEAYTTDEYNAVMYWLLHSQTGLNLQDMCAITAIYPSGSCTPVYAAGYFNCIPCCSGGGGGSVDVSFSNLTQTYSGTAKSVTVTTTPSGLSNTVTYSQNGSPVANPTNAGVYDVTVTITESGYESNGPFYSTLTINKKDLNVYADDKVVNYGSSEPVYTVSYSGFVNGETKSVLNTKPFAFINQTWPLNPGTYTISVDYGVDDNYSFNYNDGTLTVNGLSVNNVFVSNNLQSYDGTNKVISVTTDPASVGYTIEYRQNGHSVHSQINAGIYNVIITINEPGYNADLYYSTMTISKANLNVTANDTSVIYGKTQPVYSMRYSGFENGESPTVLDVLPIIGISEHWPILPGVYNINASGGVDNNYSFSYTNGKLTVIPAHVDSVQFNGLSFIYNGLNHYPVITTFPKDKKYILSVSNKDGEHLNEIIDAGIYNIEAIVTEPGYAQDTFNQILTVEKTPLLVTANDFTVNYNDPEPLYLLTLSGFVNGEGKNDIDTLPKISVEGKWPLLPGTYPIKLSAGYDVNYDIHTKNGTLKVISKKATIAISDTTQTYNGLAHKASINITPSGIKLKINYFNSTDSISPPVLPGNYKVKVTVTETGYDSLVKWALFTVKKAPLNILAENETMNYGDTIPGFDYLLSGFVNGETDSVFTTLPSLNLIGEKPLLPGNYTIVPSGGIAKNYILNYFSGTLKVNPLSVQNISVTDTLVVYDGQNHVVSAETSPGGIHFGVIYFDKNNNHITPKNAGIYSYQVTISETGYLNTVHTGKLKIEPAQLSVNMDSIEITYGQEIPEIQLHYNGFIQGESTDKLTVLPKPQSFIGWPWDAGIYAIEISGGEALNYSFTYKSSKILIHPAQITVIPDDFSIMYNDSLPVFTYKLSGFVNGENETALTKSPIISFEHENPIQPGSYTLIASGGAAANYTFNYEKGNLWVEPIGYIQIDVSDTITTYTGVAHNIIVETNPAGLNYFVEYDQTPVNAGIYEAKIKVNEPGYLPKEDSSTLTINKAPLFVHALDQTILLGDEKPAFPIEFDGFVNHEKVDVIDQLPVANIDRSWPVDAGIFTIEVYGGEDNNYEFNYTNGTLSVIQTYMINVNTSQNGWVAHSENDSLLESIHERVIVNENSSPFYAIANSGYKFVSWDNGSTDNPITFKNVNQDRTITALFDKKVENKTIPETETALIAYPIPAEENQIVSIIVKLPLDKYRLSKIIVSDISGRIIYTIENIKPENQILRLSKGVYILALQIQGEKSKFKKIIVK